MAFIHAHLHIPLLLESTTDFSNACQKNLYCKKEAKLVPKGGKRWAKRYQNVGQKVSKLKRKGGKTSAKSYTLFLSFWHASAYFCILQIFCTLSVLLAHFHILSLFILVHFRTLLNYFAHIYMLYHTLNTLHTLHTLSHFAYFCSLLHTVQDFCTLLLTFIDFFPKATDDILSRFWQNRRKTLLLSWNQYKTCLVRSGMYNIWPAGQMWPVEAFNLARETPIWFILLLPLIKTPFECVKTYQLWPLDMSKKNFGPATI